MFADEEVCPQIHRLRSHTIEHCISLAKRQQQEVDQRIGDADRVVRRQPGRFVERGMHKVVGDSAGAGACREFVCRHLRRAEAAFLQQFLRYDDDLVSCKCRADDSVWAGYIVGQTVAGRQLNVAATLFEMRNPVSLKQYLDEWMAAQCGARGCVRQTMLARLDLAEL